MHCRMDFKSPILMVILALVVVYAYHPGAKTMADAHFKIPEMPTFRPGYQNRPQIIVQNQPQLISERTLWSYIIQIASAVKTAHEAGLIVRTLDPHKILVTGQNR